MQDNVHGNGIRTIWLNQPTETPEMISRLIELKSRELRARTRRKLMGTVAGPLVATALYGYSMKEFEGIRQVLQLPFTLAFIWSIAGVYFLNRRMWSATDSDAGLSTGLASCRREIERQRDVVRRGLLWSFGPVMFAIGTFVVALALVSTRERGIFPNGLPFMILIFVWIVSVFVIRWREQRELQREAEELAGIEGAAQPRG